VYKSLPELIGRVSKEEGILAMWTGCGVNAMRAVFMNVADLAVTDVARGKPFAICPVASPLARHSVQCALFLAFVHLPVLCGSECDLGRGSACSCSTVMKAPPPAHAGILHKCLGAEIAANPIILAAITGISVVLIVSPAGGPCGDICMSGISASSSLPSPQEAGCCMLPPRVHIKDQRLLLLLQRLSRTVLGSAS
jgi:hypothetical protein